jgi:hypothetical protein
MLEYFVVAAEKLAAAAVLKDDAESKDKVCFDVVFFFFCLLSLSIDDSIVLC